MREASGMRGEQRGIFRGRSVGSEGGWWWVASGVGGGTLSTRTEIAGGSLPSDLVLISPRISPFPLSHVILSLSLYPPLSSPFSLLSSYTPRIRVCLTLSSRSLPPSFLPSFLFLSFSIFPFCPVSLSVSFYFLGFNLFFFFFFSFLFIFFPLPPSPSLFLSPRVSSSPSLYRFFPSVCAFRVLSASGPGREKERRTVSVPVQVTALGSNDYLMEIRESLEKNRAVIPETAKVTE